MDTSLHRPVALQETPVILPGHDFETVTETIAEIPLSKRFPIGWVGFLLVALALLGVLHLALGYLVMTGIGIVHIPYRGTGSLMPDLIAGRVPMIINPLLAVINQVNAGRLRLIAVTSSKRVGTLPDIPTLAESVPGYEAMSWYAMLVPAKTPPAVIQKLHAETVRALKSPEIVDILAKAGTDPVGNSPAEAEAFLKLEITRWGNVIKQAKVRID